MRMTISVASPQLTRGSSGAPVGPHEPYSAHFRKWRPRTRCAAAPDVGQCIDLLRYSRRSSFEPRPEFQHAEEFSMLKCQGKGCDTNIPAAIFESSLAAIAANIPAWIV